MYKVFLAVLILAFQGCASMTTGWTPYPGYAQRGVSDSVEVLNFQPSRKYQTLGSIHVEAMSKKAALEKSVKLAKEKGADALIVTKGEPSFLILVPWYVMDSAAIKYQGE